MSDQDEQKIVLQTEATLLQHYQDIAHQLNSSDSVAEAKAVLEPIYSQPEATQVAFLKLLAKQHNTEAADIIQAMYTLNENKEIRKEARRRLIQLEGEDIYADWTIPSGPSLTEAMANLANSEKTETDPFVAELQSLFGQAEGMMQQPEYLDVVSDFIESWAAEDFETAYRSLSTQSPLRAGLSEDDWISSRIEWTNITTPDDPNIAFAQPVEDECGPERAVVTVGWSLRLSAEATTILPEVPVATLAFKETGRHWFWTRYTLVLENDQWVILDASDEAANARQLTKDEIGERVQALNELIGDEEKLIEAELGDEDEDEDDEFDEDEDEDEDEDDDEVGMQEALLANALGHMGSMVGLMSQALNYYDALIAQAPEESGDIYKEAFNIAGSVFDIERAAYYAQQLAEKVPAERGTALRNLAYSYHSLAAKFHNEEDHEQEEHFEALVEPTIRQALAVEDSPENQILLATILIQQEKDLDEAESYLRKAQKGPLSKEDSIDVAMGLAELAMQREDNEQALHHFQTLSHLSPDDAQVWYRIGYLEHQLQHLNKAREALEQSIQLDPSLTEAYSELASIYLIEGDDKKAREVARDGLEENPEAADMYATLALIYMNSGDFRSAHKYLTQGEAIDSEDEFLQEARERYNVENKQQKSQQQRGPNKNKHHNKAKKK
ncbi:hypothetical protein KDW_34030 [Dictyobacter vulcani]|uniref:Cytochrome c-type biogenesis protein H TPR domain-containing protein n=1 Tax=Dictyobacter vulcani TaxID=2607529 RepID=A0A5J4KRZ8_9CHLR|nr:tetratricopeptide repeat protein [Dictyobacter vulcani]GER89241.1 hypothetical protein KDW_34030 [Dictyobacter vulcani]